MNTKPDREQCIILLKEKFDSEGRLPKKSDFSDTQTMMIKAYLGPWPRALEAAGIKPAPAVSASEKNLQKRIRAKKKKNMIKAGKLK